ncbi:MAG TPA: zinc ribbon domain-containing protein [Solirubrobacteraceae bacterium]
MTGPMQRIFRRRDSGSGRRSAAGLLRRPGGLLRRRSGGAKRLPWGRNAASPAPDTNHGDGVIAAPVGKASFRDRGRLRRRLRFLRRARELAFRDIGGLLFDMRRFDRDRPDLLEAKLGALAAVDQELRALERILDDRRPIHELREPGLSSCARCGALHSSEANFCPHCGLQLGGPRAMGEVGGAIAAPPQAPPPPAAAQALAPTEQPTAVTTTPRSRPESPPPTKRRRPPDETA